MIVGQQKSFLPLGIHHGLEFRLIELDDLLLLAMNPTRENHEEELPGLQDEVHATFDMVKQKSLTMLPGPTGVKDTLGLRSGFWQCCNSPGEKLLRFGRVF